MFKIANKSFTQQRAVLKPMKNNVTMFEVTEEDEEDEDNMLLNEEDDIFIEDGGSSCYSNSNGLAVTQDTRNETMLLAQFLSSTGPEEYTMNNKIDNKAQQQFKRASRLLSKLRKRPTMPALRSGQPTPSLLVEQPPPQQKKSNHVPLPVYEPPHNNNSNNNSNNNARSKSYQQQQQQSTPSLPKISTTFDNNKSNNNNYSNNNNHSNNNNYSNSNYNNNNNNNNNRKLILTPSQLRDSGIYSETGSDRNSSSVVSSSTLMSSTIPIPPLPAFLNDLQQFPQPPYVHNNNSNSNNNNKSNNHNHSRSNSNGNNSPRRPAPMPPALASAALAACSPTSTCSSNNNTSTTIRSVPEAALKRRSVRLRHVQVQTEIGTQTTTNNEDTTLIKPSLIIEGDKQACPHCRQVITTSSSSNRIRRPSCPPALSTGPILSVEDLAGQTDSKQLLAMIINLKSQLAEEKQCRIKLEKAIYQRQSDDRREILAKEKDRWAGDCLWLNDRIALLPE